jgi:hypothetical protein
MAQFTVDILPDEKIEEGFAGFCYLYRYEMSKLENETPADFVRRKTLEWLKAQMELGLQEKAAADARDAKAAEVANVFTLQ